ncbi:MAG: branched-chain amino acid ABC transporter permease [Chloroflexi bacterium]|nr:branched-chain amino acid ABC transporter permease [Chloroflexota bacterium]
MSPGRISALLAAGLLILGFLPFIKLGLVVNGLILGSVIALGAIGLTLVYGILKLGNFAHGDYMAFGAYVAFFIVDGVLPRVGIEGAGLGPFTFGFPVLIALPLAALVVALGAIALDALIYRRLRDRAASTAILMMASLGVAIAIRGLVQLIWSGETQHYPRESRQVYHLPMDVRIPPDGLFVAVLAIILVAGVYALLTHTKMGKAMRATSDNPTLALVSGINTKQVVWWTWGIGGALAAVAGVLLAVVQAQLLPIMGWKFLIPLFAAVILGGIGNPYGALIGALVVGVSMELSTQWINPSYKPAVAFAIMIGVLLARPRGIFGDAP